MNEINQENEEEINSEEKEEVEDIDIRQPDKKPRKAKNSGIGTVMKIDNDINKDEVINALVKSSNNQVMDIQTLKEYMVVQTQPISKICNVENLRTLLGQDFDRMTFREYILRSKSFLPMLDDYNFSKVEKQFSSIAHKPGTSIIIEKFFPFYTMNEEAIRDDKRLKAVNITLINSIFPSDRIRLYGVPGKNDAIGGEKGALTYAEKLSGSFGFLKKYSFKESPALSQSLENLLIVINEYKNSYNAVNGYPICENYSMMWRYALDTIAHHYLEKNLIPDASEFTLEALLKAFPLAKMARFFLEPYETDEIKQMKSEFSIDTTMYIPKFGYFTLRARLNELISMIALPKGYPQSYYLNSMPKNNNGPQNKLNRPDSKQPKRQLFK